MISDVDMAVVVLVRVKRQPCIDQSVYILRNHIRYFSMTYSIFTST
jgi:hypothetical protein